MHMGFFVGRNSGFHKVLTAPHMLRVKCSLQTNQEIQMKMDEIIEFVVAYFINKIIKFLNGISPLRSPGK